MIVEQNVTLITTFIITKKKLFYRKKVIVIKLNMNIILYMVSKIKNYTKYSAVLNNLNIS